MKKVILVLAMLTSFFLDSFCQDAKPSFFSNKKEICAFLKNFDKLVSENIDDYDLTFIIGNLLEEEKEIYIQDERIYDLLILCMQDDASSVLLDNYSSVLEKRGDPQIIYKKSRQIKSIVSLEKILPIVCFLKLTRKEKHLVFDRLDQFGRAYLGDEQSLQAIADKFKNTQNVEEKKLLASQLGKIGDKNTVSVLSEDFCKEEYIRGWLYNYSYKYWLPYAMQYVGGEDGRYFGQMIKKIENDNLLYVWDEEIPNYYCDRAKFQRNFLQYVKNYILQKYGVKACDIKDTDLLYYENVIENDDED